MSLTRGDIDRIADRVVTKLLDRLQSPSTHVSGSGDSKENSCQEKRNMESMLNTIMEAGASESDDEIANQLLKRSIPKRRLGASLKSYGRNSAGDGR